jgi:uncharacterized protein YutE (UPF0331/DUF86 family)
MADDVILNKAGIIERCIARVREEHDGNDSVLSEDMTKQDSIILNLQRACEASIDLAMHLVSRQGLGVPQESRDAFALLEEANLIEQDLAELLVNMVGFRNIAVHDYRKLDLEIVVSIINKQLDVFLEFSRWAIKHSADVKSDSQE